MTPGLPSCTILYCVTGNSHLPILIKWKSALGFSLNKRTAYAANARTCQRSRQNAAHATRQHARSSRHCTNNTPKDKAGRSPSDDTGEPLSARSAAAAATAYSFQPQPVMIRSFFIFTPTIQLVSSGISIAM